MTDIEKNLERIYSSPGPHHPIDIAWLVTQVRWFLLENDHLKSEVEAARAEAATMRSWAEEAAKAENANAEDAKRERAAVVAWLRREVDDDDNAEGSLACILAYAANAIERGEHRREGGE